jgi:hypothetical protein
MVGESSLKSKSKDFLNSLSLAWWEALLLLGSGALAVVLHQSLRLPLGLPGRHGIEWMALLVLGRSTSRFRWAGSLTSTGAALTLLMPVWGVRDDPFIWLIYLLPGIVMDLVFYWLPQLQNKLWFWAGLGGLAHATKPLARWVISLASGWAYGSLLNGMLYPLSTHILFGMLGGLLGAAISLTGKRLIESK